MPLSDSLRLKLAQLHFTIISVTHDDNNDLSVNKYSDAPRCLVSRSSMSASPSADVLIFLGPPFSVSVITNKMYVRI